VADRTLFISDLDGTLLNSNAEISEYATERLNKLIDAGMNFTFATARKAESSLAIMKNVNLKLPIILLNGVCIYDPINNNYVQINSINNESLQNIFETQEKYNLHGIFNSIDENIVHYSILDKRENLIDFYEELSKDANINIEFYRHIYDGENWFLEIGDKSASKYNAVQFIRKAYDKVIGFGDNLNDIPLFKACDYCCAVENANPEVKKFAHEIIESNMNDGVIKWLLLNYGHGFDYLID